MFAIYKFVIFDEYFFDIKNRSQPLKGAVFLFSCQVILYYSFSSTPLTLYNNAKAGKIPLIIMCQNTYTSYSLFK